MEGNEESGEVGAVEDTSTGTAAAVIVDGESGSTNDALAGEQQGNEDEAADADSQQERGADGKFKKPAKERIAELTRARHEADREAAYWRAQALNNTATSAPAAPTKPTVDQFEDYGDYVEALTDWKADQAVAKRMAEDSSRKVGEVRAQTFMERQADFAKTTPDYAESLSNSNAPIAEHVIEAAHESQVGPQLLYHFVKNPEVLANLNGMDVRAADREIGRLEAMFLTKPAAPAAPAKKVTQAPAPAGTLNSQGRATTPNLADASMDDYMAQRKTQGARWAR